MVLANSCDLQIHLLTMDLTNLYTLTFNLINSSILQKAKYTESVPGH